jgi:thiol-disulfide isomerase/thioredoxin
MNKEVKGIGTPAIVAIGAVILVLIGAVYFNMRPEAEKMMEVGEELMHDGEVMMKEGETSMKDGEAMMKEGEAMMEGAPGKYQGEIFAGGDGGPVLLDFKKADYDKAISEGKLITLFFYASWCPTCKIEFPKMVEAFNEVVASSDGAIQNVVGFRVNYNDPQTDNDEKALAREFGVAYQHTKVFVKAGERILKAPDSWGKDRYITEIKNALK